MTEMAKGANIAVAAPMVRAALMWTGGPDVPDVDGSALLLRSDGKVASDDDMVFYNQPQHPSGSVRQAGTSVSNPGSRACYDVMDVNFAMVPADVDRIALVASADGGTFGEVPDLRLVLSDLSSGAELAVFAMQAGGETAFVTGELYRRDGGWKFRAVGQGYDSGLAGLATDFGISVDDDTTDVSSAPPPADAPVLPPPSWDAPQPPAPPAAEAPPAPAPPPPAPVEPPPVPAATAPPPQWGIAVPPSAPVPTTPAPVTPAPVTPAPAAPAPAAPSALGGAPVSLTKNQRVELHTEQTGPLNRVMMQLGWESGPSRTPVDLDASVIAFDASGEKQCIVWYQHRDEYMAALQHAGDNQGAVEGGSFAETIYVELSRLPESCNALVFTINSFKGQTFTDISRAYAVLRDDQGTELLRYDLTDTQPSTALLISVIKRSGPGLWHLRTVGEFHDCRTVRKLVHPAARQALM